MHTTPSTPPTIALVDVPNDPTVGAPGDVALEAGRVPVAVARIRGPGRRRPGVALPLPALRGTFTWTPAAPGTYLLTAVARGEHGSTRASGSAWTSRPARRRAPRVAACPFEARVAVRWSGDRTHTRSVHRDHRLASADRGRGRVRAWAGSSSTPSGPSSRCLWPRSVWGWACSAPRSCWPGPPTPGRRCSPGASCWRRSLSSACCPSSSSRSTSPSSKQAELVTANLTGATRLLLTCAVALPLLRGAPRPAHGQGRRTASGSPEPRRLELGILLVAAVFAVQIVDPREPDRLRRSRAAGALHPLRAAGAGNVGRGARRRGGGGRPDVAPAAVPATRHRGPAPRCGRRRRA